MNKPLLILPILLSFLMVDSAFAQQRFRISAVVGTNFSQVDGDNFTGYDKFGIGGGLRASTVFTKKFRLDYELLYSQRGAYSGRFEGFTRTPHTFKLSLNYAEIPILATYQWNRVKGKKRQRDWHRYAFSMGVTVGRLINYKLEERLNTITTPPDVLARITSLKLLEEHFIRTDLGWTVGGSIYFSRHFGVTMRHAISLTPLYQPIDNDNIGQRLVNYYVTTLAFYEF